MLCLVDSQGSGLEMNVYGGLQRTLCSILTAAGIIALSATATAEANQYFINNQAGSRCSDAGPHSQTQPWCSFAPINRIAVLSPGDQILLARGAIWNEQLTLTGSGNVAQPITLSAYGSGPNPKILRNQATADICVLLTNVSNWNIEHLEVGKASVGILLHYTELSHEGITINDVNAHDNKGIWSGFSREYPVSHRVVDPFAASLNINLSAGILFNISSSLSFSSSQYVAKGISVSNILGTHNVDSVAFDAEIATTDGEDGHNAFQNVMLNGLILNGDDGHVGKEYQSAGLGCSDSLRLLGVMNLTLLDSVLYDEAACRTSLGTAAVILGRVQNVTLTNNIVFGVPSTSSPDETGIDLEFSESHVNTHGNFFAQNAGPGIEILNIHPTDHTSDVNLVDNAFLDNARTLHGAASVWEKNAGAAYAVPSGSIGNSLYSESSGSFFEGNAGGLITQFNNISTLTLPNYAAEQFSTQQGTNYWHYMYETGPAGWSDIPRYVPTDYNGAWEVNPAQYVSAFALAPASCSGNCDTGGVARVWVAPQSGNVDLRGWILKSDSEGGSGVYAEINLVSGQSVKHLWPASGDKQLIAGTVQAGFATDVSSVSIRAGDMIRFEVTANGDNSYDTVSWTPSLAYVSAPRMSIPRTPRRIIGSPSLPKLPGRY